MLGAGRPRLRLIGTGLYLLEALGGAIERLRGAALGLREPRLGLLELADKLALGGAIGLELMLGDIELHRGLLGLLQAPRRLLRLPVAFPRLIGELGLSLGFLGFANPAFGLQSDPLLLCDRGALPAVSLGLLEPGHRLALRCFANRSLLLGPLAGGHRSARGGSDLGARRRICRGWRRDRDLGARRGGCLLVCGRGLLILRATSEGGGPRGGGPNGPGGKSSTIGPSRRSSGNPEYGVSEFGVNTNWLGVPSSRPNTLFATIPARRFAFQVAMIDTLG